MLVGRVERTIGPKDLGHVQRVTHEVKDGVFIQTGETIEHGKTTFKEVIEKGYNYFKRTFQSFNKDGEVIRGSEFMEKLTGEAANKKQVRNFGVII